ncbi:lipoprotein [Neptunomonas marina]
MSWLILCAGMLLVSGCGQKGPLYLPDESTQSETEQTQ